MATASIDDRGRVVIPHDMRAELGLRAGQPVTVERAEGGVVIRPAVPMREALRRLREAAWSAAQQPQAGSPAREGALDEAPPAGAAVTAPSCEP